MKKIVAIIAILVGFISTTSFAGSDECETALCMAGAAQGNGKMEKCSGAYKKYFSLREYGRKGREDWQATYDLRKRYLKRCEGADSDTINLIQQKFGKSAEI